MILRRLAQNLKEQNWTAIVLEFVLLVAGVFFGIQVSNWNEARHEARQGAENLERIRVDLAGDITALERRLVFWKRVSDYGHAAIGYAETGELVAGSAWQTLLAFYQASQLFPYVAQDTTYQELRSAGELALFDSAELRTALADYYVNGAGPAANFLFRVEPDYHKLIRGLTPTVASAQVWSKCHESPNAGEQTLLDCESPTSEADAQAVLDGYLADPRVLPELRFWITNLDVMSELIQTHESAAHELLERLRAEASQ